MRRPLRPPPRPRSLLTVFATVIAMMAMASMSMRILTASVLRHWRTLRRYPLDLTAILVWPVAFAFAFIITARTMAGAGPGLDAFAGRAGTAEYGAFLAIGVATWGAMNYILWTFGLSLRREQAAGTLEALWMTPVPRVLLMAGRGAWDLFFAAALFGVSLIEFRLLFGIPWRGGAGALAAVFAATLPALYGLGLAFASLVLWTKETHGAVFFARGIFTIFAGLTYPLSVLPGWMQAVAAWLPLTYTVNAVRRIALDGASVADLAPVVWPLLGLGALLLAAGHAAFAWTERRVKRLGTMGAF